MDVARYIARLAEKFDSQAETWPDLADELTEISGAFAQAVLRFAGPDRAGFADALDRASQAHFRLARAHAARTSYGYSHFFEQTREFLSTLHKARRLGEPRLAGAADLPRGDALMYRGLGFLKGLCVDAAGQVATWSLRNHSANESAFVERDGEIHVVDAGGTPSATVLFAVPGGEDRLLLSVFANDPLNLHCFVFGPSAECLRGAREAIAAGDVSAWPEHPPMVSEGSDNYNAIHIESGRMRGGKRFNAPVLLSIGANRYWKFSRTLRLADIVRKMPKNGPSHAPGFDFAALCREEIECASSVVLGGYVTIHHIRMPRIDGDIFALEGFGRLFMIGADFSIGDPGRFRDRMTAYIEHFVEAPRAAAASAARCFYQIARVLFRAAPPEREARGLTVGYGNWRLGDCSFALTSARQMADLGHEMEILGQDSELLGFDAAETAGKPYLNRLFGDAAAKRIRFCADHVDALSDLLTGTLGLAPGRRYRFQHRARAYGSSWQKIMFPEFGGQRQDIVLGWPVARRDPARAFGVFFTLDLEKRRWLEQETFLEELAVWCAGLPGEVAIYINGMTSYRQPHRMGLPTIKTFVLEEGIVAGIEARIAARVPGFAFRSMAERPLADKCRIVADEIDYCIGPLGSGTVVPAALYAKPSLIYTSHAMFKINRDSYKSLDLLLGPYSELVPLEWVSDVDARDHRIFPEAEMTNYSIPAEAVLDLAKAQIGYHLRKQS